MVVSVNVCIVLCEGTVEAFCPVTLATLPLNFDLKSIISIALTDFTVLIFLLNV